MRRARADNLLLLKKTQHIDVSFSLVWPVTDNEFRHGIVKVVCGSTGPAISSSIHTYFDNVVTKFMINNSTDAWKTDVILLNISYQVTF